MVEKEVLENGTYEMFVDADKENPQIADLELTIESGEKKVWKVKEMNSKEIIFSV